MKKVKVFILENCPFCKKALKLMEKYPFGEGVELEIIDEAKEAALANQYDYYYVPCFYLNEEKIHEGALSEDGMVKLVEKVQKF